jgi:CSLREA domain-containing protein
MANGIGADFGGTGDDNPGPISIAIRTTLALIVLLASSLSVGPAVRAAAFTVTKTGDTTDGTCNADCSLREAITAADALSISDGWAMAQEGIRHTAHHDAVQNPRRLASPPSAQPLAF